MKLCKIMAMLCALTCVSSAQVQIGKNVQIGGNANPSPTEIQVNGVDTLTQSPINFVNSPSVDFINPSAGIINAITNFANGIQMQPVPPVTGQYVVLYPSVVNGSSGGSVTAHPPSLIVSDPFCLFGGAGSLQATGFILPSYINPANVTAVYGFAFAGNYSNYGSQTCFGNPSNPGTFVMTPFALTATGVGPSGFTASANPNLSFGLQQITTTSTGITGANISSAAITATANISVGFNLGATFYMPSEGLIVYYTGPAPPANTTIAVTPPLSYDGHALSIDSSFAFPGSYLYPYTVAQALAAMGAFQPNALLWEYDATGTTSSPNCMTGGGTVKALCAFDGAHTLTAFSSGGGGGGTPGGANTDVQYNNSGVFGGDPNFTTDGAGNVVAKTGTFNGTGPQVTLPETTAPTTVSGKQYLQAIASTHTTHLYSGVTDEGPLCTVGNALCGSSGLTDNTLINSASTGLFFAETDSIGLISTGNFPEDLATLLGIPSGNQRITAIGSATLADMLSCATAGAGSCTQDGTWPLTFPLGVTTNSKALLEPAYNDLSLMISTPTNPQLSYYAGGLKAWALEFGIPDSRKIAANNTTYCTTTGTWTAATSVPGAGTFPSGTIKTSTPGATLVCTMQNATDAGIIGLKTTGSTTATFTVDVLNSGTTYHVADPYTASATLNQTAAYGSVWGGISNFYAVGQAGLPGGYTTVTVTASNNSSDPVYVVAPYFLSPSSSLQNAPAVEIMLESRAGCNGTCSSISGPQHNDANTNIMRAAQTSVVNELRSNGLNISYFDPNATPVGFNSSDSTQTSDGTHPNSTSGHFIANTAFPQLNSAATTQDHFLPAVASSGGSGCTVNCTITSSTSTAALTLTTPQLGLDMVSTSTIGSQITMRGSGSGVHNWTLLSSGSGLGSASGGNFFLGDLTSGIFSWKQSVNSSGVGYVENPSQISNCWSSSVDVTSTACDTWLSRLSANTFGVGSSNGAFDGTFKAATGTFGTSLTVGGNNVCQSTGTNCPAGGGSTIVASAEVVTFSATPTFSTTTNVSRIVMTGNITSFTLGAGSDGQDKTLCFKQDATGSRTLAGPAGVHGLFTIDPTASKWNCQNFVYDNTDSIWLAAGPGTVAQ